jgi:GTP cyclohydrolase I
MTIADWLARNVTDDPRALEWFDDPEAEDRIRRAYRQLLDGYRHDPAAVLKTTRTDEGQHAGIVRVGDIAYWSICAHHFLPFFGHVTISYAPGSKILGLGKLPRLVQILSKRFQIQEDLVKEIAEVMMTAGDARGVVVTATGRHLCMCSRGPADASALTTTSYSAGLFAGATGHEGLRLA